MSEIARVIETASHLHGALSIEMKFQFETEVQSVEFEQDCKALNPLTIIPTKPNKQGYVSSIRIAFQADEAYLKQQCLLFRNKAAGYNGVPFKWLIRTLSPN